MAMGASVAWRAEDAVDNGANTTTLPSYVGSVPLTRDATGHAVKAVSAFFTGRMSVTFAGGDPVRGYSGTLAVGTGATIVSVVRVTAAAAGTHAMTVAGAINTGNSSAVAAGSTHAQKIVTAASKAFTVPGKLILVTVFDAAGAANYTNSYTPVTVTSAGALVGDTFTIGALSTAGDLTLTGEWRCTGYWPSALSAAEVGGLLTALGQREGVTISP
jgi:hypothetical protein